MKFSKYIIFAILATGQLSAQAESKHEHEHHEKHSEKSHDEHKHEEAGHEKHDDHDEHKHEKDGHDKHEDHEEHGSHEHGVAQMTIAVGGNGLEIQLETPAANILGFEHKASSDEDKKTLKMQKTKLENLATLFSVNKEADCVPAATKIESSLFEEHDDHDDHKEDKHSEKAHNDIDVNWTFTCKNSKEINNVSVNLFSAFPKGFEQIKVDWISATSASTVSLTEDGIINFK